MADVGAGVQPETWPRDQLRDRLMDLSMPGKVVGHV